MRRIWIAFLGTLTLAGCAGDVRIMDASGNELPGVPFRVPYPFIKRGLHVAHSKGGACTPVSFVELTSMAAGPILYVRPVTAPLAQTSFSTKVAESGALTEITLNSEPAAADTIRAVTEAAKVGLAAVGVAAAAAAPPRPDAAPIAPACDSGQDQVTFEPFNPPLPR